jgi:organic radical activating enzyme
MNTFCSLPWIHLATHPHGPITLCCEASQTNRISESFNNVDGRRNFNTLGNTDYDFVTLMNNDNFNQVRKDMLEGKEPEACKKCYVYERNNLESKRVREAKRIDFDIEDAKQITNPDGSINQIDFEFIELRLGNHCNLACRSCNPMSSSRWIADFNKLNGGKFLEPKESFNWPLDKNFWDKLKVHSNKLKYIYINGGEPLLIDKHADFLKYLVDNGYSKNIVLQYSTNGTVTNDIYIDLWKNFKHIELMISIDDLYDRNFYTRYPAKWNDIEKNLDWFLSLRKYTNIHPIICQSISTLNVFYMDEFWNYFDNIGLKVIHNYVVDPDYYSIVHLPDSVKEILLDRFKDTKFIDPLKDFMYSTPSNSDIMDKFFDITKNLDTIRNQKFENYLEDWSKVLHTNT